MLLPAQYSLAEANQMVPFLETSFEGIGALLVRMHQIRLQLSARSVRRGALDPERDSAAPAERSSDELVLGDASPSEASPGPAAVGAAVEGALAAYGRVMRALARAQPPEPEAEAGYSHDLGTGATADEAEAPSSEGDASPWRAALREAELELGRELELLQRMGVLVHSLDPPTVHLRSQRGATPVMLSWRPGEPAFLHWHSLDWGLEERAPIDDPHLFGDAVLPC